MLCYRSRVQERHIEAKCDPSRFGGTFIAITDKYGVIDLAKDMEEAQARIAEAKR